MAYGLQIRVEDISMNTYLAYYRYTWLHIEIFINIYIYIYTQPSEKKYAYIIHIYIFFTWSFERDWKKQHPNSKEHTLRPWSLISFSNKGTRIIEKMIDSINWSRRHTGWALCILQCQRVKNCSNTHIYSV